MFATRVYLRSCSRKGLSMRNRYNLTAVLSAVVLACCAALILSRGVNAAGEGKITGTSNSTARLRT